MKHVFYLSSAVFGIAVLSSCSGKLAPLSADNFTITPSPLEVVGKNVPATINGRFPEKYLRKNATVTIVPELRYTGGKVVGQSATFQGENVIGNDQVINYKVGGNYVMKSEFPYTPTMAESELYLTFDAMVGKKRITLPAVKVADGVVATSQLVYQTVKSANTATAEDGYQRQITRKQDAQIKYLINQAKIRTSELNCTSIRDFLQVLRDIKADHRGLALDNIEVTAYASPDGTLSFNDKLADQRRNSATEYVNGQLKKNQLRADVDTKYTAEDWEGFKELVSQSNIQDKEVILRVLSLYKDPEEREQQIKNLSQAFRELADEILPELRRARMAINYHIVGHTDEEILTLYADDPTKLSIEELLYAASLTKDSKTKRGIYEKTLQLFPQDHRAANGLAQIAIQENDIPAAKRYLAQADNLPEGNANAALLALRNGELDNAETLLGRALTANNYNEVLGNLQIARGNYVQAAQSLKGIKSNSAALAQILTKDYVAAQQTLMSITHPDAMTGYLTGIVCARTGNIKEGAQALNGALSKDPSLKSIMAHDLDIRKILEAYPTLIQ